MITLYSIFFVLGVVAFVMMAKLGIVMRISIAFAIFIIPSVIATLWLLKIGDKPPPDSIIIDPSTMKEMKNGEKE